MDANLKYLLAGFILQTIFIGVLAFYLIPKQYGELRKPRSKSRFVQQFDKLRWYWLALLITSLISTIPGYTYRICRFVACSYALELRNIATITSTLSQLAILVILILVVTFKYQEK